MTTIKQEPSCPAHIYVAGNYDDAARTCREYCRRGACVRLTRAEYIYTGGQESGLVVSFINYPRFPSNPQEIMSQARILALMLLDALHQQSCTIEGPNETIWISNRPTDHSPPNTGDENDGGEMSDNCQEEKR